MIGLLLLYQAGVPQLGNWLLLYAALSVTASLASSSGQRESAESLAITSTLGAYGAAALFVSSPSAQSISPQALFAYLAVLAGGLLDVSARQEWAWLPIVGSVAAFFEIGLLYEQVPHRGLAVYPLA